MKTSLYPVLILLAAAGAGCRATGRELPTASTLTGTASLLGSLPARTARAIPALAPNQQAAASQRPALDFSREQLAETQARQAKPHNPGSRPYLPYSRGSNC